VNHEESLILKREMHLKSLLSKEDYKEGFTCFVKVDGEEKSPNFFGEWPAVYVVPTAVFDKYKEEFLRAAKRMKHGSPFMLRLEVTEIKSMGDLNEAKRRD
jgi:hypothetical protein